jgi:hypothetical protein
MLTLGAAGLSVWRAVVVPIRAARDSPNENAKPTIPTRARHITMPRILTNQRADEFVFMARI